MPSTRSSRVAIDHRSLGDGEPLVLLHGFMGRRDLWAIEGWVGRLANRRLILLDARGHGRSERPTDPSAYTPSADAADVVACLDALGIPDAVVCGWSMGAVTALTLAALPEAGHGRRRPWAAARRPAVRRHAPRGPRRRAGVGARFRARRDAVRREGLTSEGRPVWARLLGAADPGAMAARIRGTVAAARLAEHLRDIRQPLLLVWAEEEVPVPSLPLPPHARVVVLPGLDHVGVMEHPDLVVPELLAFLSAEDEGPGPANGHG